MEDEPINETTADYLKMMLMSINRIDESIINILHYSRNTRLKVTYELVDMKEMITGILDELKYLPGHTIETSLEIEGPATIYTDKQRLGTMLTNLISNAFKYSQQTEQEASFVKLSVFSDNQQITIKIEDNGEGIAAEHQKKIFDMFYRASSSNVGSGLGLYICKEMAAKMGGSISVSSQKNAGTTFTVVLPVVTKES